MKQLRSLTAALCFLLCSLTLVEAQDLDTELSNLATNLASTIKGQEKKKVAVIDFTDLDGASNELGKYVAEQLTVNLVMARQNFSVLDRANLKKILAEHKLTATGLVDPDNAKKLGQFAGVDAIILGTVIPKGTNHIGLTAKIITTDTAEIIGAARAEFKVDEITQQLVAKPTVGDAGGVGSSGDLLDDKPKVVKSFGDLRIELQSLKVIKGNQCLLTLTFGNQSKNKSIWVALNADDGGNIRGLLTDSSGTECGIPQNGLSGIERGHQFVSYQTIDFKLYGFEPATEIKSGDSLSATIRFVASRGRPTAQGACRLQLEILLGHDFNPKAGSVSVQNLLTKIEAE